MSISGGVYRSTLANGRGQTSWGVLKCWYSARISTSELATSRCRIPDDRVMDTNSLPASDEIMGEL